MSSGRLAHWQSIYKEKGENQVSRFHVIIATFAMDGPSGAAACLWFATMPCRCPLRLETLSHSSKHAVTIAGPRWVAFSTFSSACSAARSSRPIRLRQRQRLVEIGDDVFFVFDPDRQPHNVGSGARLQLLCVAQLPVRRRGRVDDQRARVADIGKMR
jgi:hypothetical protein